MSEAGKVTGDRLYIEEGGHLRWVLTPDELAELHRQQEHVKMLLGWSGTLAKLTPEQDRAAFNMRVEESLRARLGVADELGLTDADRIEIAEGIAWALRNQGRIMEAMRVAPESLLPQLEREYAALVMDDEEECDCEPDTAEVLPGRHMLLPHQMVQHSLISHLHDGDTVHYILCTKCGHLNARPRLTPVLRDLRSAQSRRDEKGNTLPDHQLPELKVIPDGNEVP